MCFKPKYIHFVYSFVALVAFSSCLRREDQFVVVVFVFPRGVRGHAVVMVNDPFSDLPFFLVVKNPYELRSQIRFCVLPEKRTLTVGFIVWTTNGC